MSYNTVIVTYMMINGKSPIDQGLYREVANFLGTTDPWRAGGIAVLKQEGVQPGGWYNPVTAPGEPRLGRIFTEVLNTSANGLDVVVVGPDNKALVSIVELGHVLTKAVLGGTGPYLQLAHFTGDDEASVRLRKLVMTAVDTAKTLLPPGLFHVADPTIVEPERQARFYDWLRSIAGRIVRAQQSGEEWVSTTPPVLGAQPLGQPQVFLSGTSVAASAAKSAFNAEAARRGLLVVDSYTGTEFSEADMHAEYRTLKASQVSAVMITNDTETIAGVADTPPRAALAAMNLNRRDANGAPLQQAFGLFIERSDKTKLTPAAMEMRRALLLHVKAIQRRFPNAVYLSTSPQDLAAWAHRSINR